ncbi:hypothetical protein HAHE_38620 [Haloferula helveola]|uniref:Uncharacterized protein n=1 Tax=Haloferula helveola TaxID=490095 RepID=A0ABM7RE44_9BACT|nr:hypothetical protein HAHE_38620 [Haloferula helveola]
MSVPCWCQRPRSHWPDFWPEGRLCSSCYHLETGRRPYCSANTLAQLIEAARARIRAGLERRYASADAPPRTGKG